MWIEKFYNSAYKPIKRVLNFKVGWMFKPPPSHHEAEVRQWAVKLIHTWSPLWLLGFGVLEYKYRFLTENVLQFQRRIALEKQDAEEKLKEEQVRQAEKANEPLIIRKLPQWPPPFLEPESEQK